jgi:hypothetical protein
METAMNTSGSGYSFQSFLGAIPVTVFYWVEDGFVTPMTCDVGGKVASLLDDGDHFSPVQLRVWQRAAEADYSRRTGADFEPDPTDFFSDPAGCATRSLASYFDRVDAAARWGA